VRQGAADNRKKSGKRIYGIGMPMGVDSSDSYFSFLTFMDAYNVKLVDDNGKVLVERPKVRRGSSTRCVTTRSPTRRVLAAVVDQLEGPDNNVAFHNKTTIMTHNATISHRREVVRRHEQHDAVAATATRRRRTTTRTSSRPASRRSPTARR
jgi:hypothetical protein